MVHLKTTWQHIRRSPYQALASIMIMTFTLFVAAAFLLLAAGSHAVLRYFEAQPQVTVFFKDKVTRGQVDKVKKILTGTGKISSLKYISKEEALAIYKEQNKNDPLLLEMVTADILPASLEISATDVTYLKELYDLVKKQPQVEEVVFQKDIVDTMISWTQGIRKIGIGVVSLLSLISIFIIITVIGMKIALRKEEIEILRLIGATNWYIRWPFLLEGIFYGISGAFFAWGITYLVIWQATPFLSSFLSGLSLVPVSPLIMFLLLGILISGGIIVGGIGSLLASWRYLK